jgi:hypothetical protein
LDDFDGGVPRGSDDRGKDAYEDVGEVIDAFRVSFTVDV